MAVQPTVAKQGTIEVAGQRMQVGDIRARKTVPVHVDLQCV